MQNMSPIVEWSARRWGSRTSGRPLRSRRVRVCYNSRLRQHLQRRQRRNWTWCTTRCSTATTIRRPWSTTRSSDGPSFVNTRRLFANNSPLFVIKGHCISSTCGFSYYCITIYNNPYTLYSRLLAIPSGITFHSRYKCLADLFILLISFFSQGTLSCELFITDFNGGH